MGLSFYVMASWVGGMVGDSLFEQRIRTDRASLESLAVRIAPTLAQSDAPALQRQLIAAGGELGGRVLLLDQNGKVQLDSYGEIQGTRLEYPEIVSILVKGQNVDYGCTSWKRACRWIRPICCSPGAPPPRGWATAPRVWFTPPT